MNRQERHHKASEIRQVISDMRNDLKTASTARKAELFSDLDVAMDDYETYMDDGLWGMDEDFQPGEPIQPDLGMGFDEDDDDLDSSLEIAPELEDLELEDPEFDDVDDAMDEYMDEYMDDGLLATDVPLGALDDHSNQYASEHRAHVSYILDRTAEVVASIENYEARAKKSKKASRSSGARKALASHMKALASVVASADFSSPDAGEALSAVGVGVMAMHKALKAS